VHAQREDELIATTAGAAIGINGSGLVSIAAAATAAVAINETGGSSLATIDTGSVVINAASIEVSANDDSLLNGNVAAVSFSAGGSGGGTLNVTLAAAVADNTMGSRTAAVVSDATLSSAGRVDVLATNEADLISSAAGVGISISVSAVFAFAAAGDAVVSINSISGATEALVENGADIDAVGPITVQATDDAQLDAAALAVSASVGISLAGILQSASGSGASGAFALALGATVVDNEIGGSVVALIEDSDVTSGSGTVDVRASGEGVAHVAATAMSLSIAADVTAGIGIAAAVTASTNTITSAVEARIAGSGVAATGVVVDARDTRELLAVTESATAAIAGGGLGTSISFGSSLSFNDIGGSVVALIDDSSVSSGGALDVRASGTGAAQVVATSLALSLTGGAAAIGISASATVSTNAIASAIDARIDGSDVEASAIVVDARDARELLAVTASASAAISGGGVGTSIAFASSLSFNDVGGQVRASIVDSDVTAASGGVTVNALADTALDAISAGMALAVSSGGMAISLAGAGSSAVNDTYTNAEAFVVGSTLGAPGAIVVHAADAVDVFAEAAALALSYADGISGSLSGALAGSVTLNTHTARTESIVDASTLASSDATVTIDAISQSVLFASPQVAALALSGNISNILSANLSLAGSAAVARNTTAAATPGGSGAQIGAQVRNGSTVSGRSVTVAAHDELDATAVLVSLSVGVGFASGAVAVGLGENILDTATSATVSGSSLTATAGDIVIDADATQMIGATSIAVAANLGIAGFAGTGAVATTEIRGDVAASARDAILAATGSVRIDAGSAQTAKAVVDGAAVSASFGAGVAVMEATADIGGTTRAYADGTLTIQSAALEVTADSSSQALPDGVSFAVGFGGAGTGAVIDGRVSRLTEAYVGTRAGTTPGALSSITVGGGDVLIDAGSASTVTTMPASLGIGGANISVALTKATIDGATLAYVGEKTTVNAGELDVVASSTENAAADNILVSLGGAFAVGVSESTATIDSDTEAFTGTRVGNTPTPGAATTIVLTPAGNGDGTARIEANGSHTTTATAAGGSASFGITVNVFLPTADTSGSVRAYAGENTLLTADDLTVTANAPVMTANASIAAGSIAGFATVDVLQSLAKVTGEVEAFIGAQAADMTTASATPVIDISGDVLVNADATMTASATALGASISFGLDVDVVEPQARVSGATRAYVREGAAVDAASLTVEAGNDADRVEYDANAASIGADFAGLAAISVVNADAAVDGVVEAFVGAPNGVGVPAGLPSVTLDIGGPVNVTARSMITADAAIQGGNAATVTVSVLAPVADAGGATRAYAGDGLNVRSTQLNLSADGSAAANSDITSFDFSLIASVTDITPVARTSNIVEAYVGENRDTLRLDQADIQVRNTAGGRGTVNVDATASTLADADIFGVSGSFGVTVNVIQPKAELIGATRAYVGPRTDLFAGPVTLDASETSARAVAKMSGGSGALIANVSVIRAEAAASRLTETFVGHHADIDLGGDSLTAHADMNTGAPLAEATITTGSGGGIANVSTFAVEGRVGLVDSADANSQASATRAFVDHNAAITAGALTLEADSNTEAEADVSQPLGFGGVVNVSLIDVKGVAAHDTDAYVGDDVTLTLSGALRIDANARTTARPSVANNSASLGVSYAQSEVTTEIDSDTRAWIGEGGTITALSVRVVADAEHDADAQIDTNGFSGVVSIGDLVARAEDTGSVEARIGPSGAGSSGNRTAVTATDAGGIDVDAILDSRVTSSPDLGSFSLLGSGGQSESFAENDSSVLARIGGWADLEATSGTIDVQADMQGVAKADAAATAAAAGVAVAFANADAKFRPNVDLTVGSNANIATGGSSINLTARLNHNGSDFLTNETSPGYGAIGDAQKLAVAALGSGSDSTVSALADADLLIDVGTNATFDAASGDINVLARNSNTAFATLSSISGALVAVSTGDAKPTAEGSTTLRFDGGVGVSGAAGANNLNILAEGYTTADTSFASSTGGLVSVSGTGTVRSTVNADMNVFFGSSSSDIKVDGGINVQALQSTDGDAKTKGGSGGAVDVNSLDSDVIATADVDLTVGSANIIEAGGQIRFLAQHGVQAAEVSDGTIIQSVGADPTVGTQSAGATNYIDFGAAHELRDGASVTFVGSAGGLTNERQYSVVVRDANTLYLGGTWSGGVNTIFDTIVIPDHNLQTGDSVYYHANGLTPVGGLTTGKRYIVTKVDNDTIKLKDPAETTPDSVYSRNDVAGNTITDSHFFSNGDAVTYRLVAPKEFSAGFIDVNVTNTNPFTTVVDNQNRIYIPGHGFSAGERVVYRSSGTNDIQVSGGPNLVDGGIYYVANGGAAIGLSPGFAFNGDYIRLARTLNDAIGFINNNGTPANPADDFYVPPNVMNLVRDVNNTDVHSLRAERNEALDGLEDGRVYFVTGSNYGGGVTPGTQYQLSLTSGGGTHSFDNDGISGGTHRFTIDGENLTSSGSFAVNGHDIILDIDNGATGSFDGIGGARGATGAPSGDLKFTASTTGAGGGLVEVGAADADATATVDTDITINSATIRGDEVLIETKSFLQIAATADSAGGGGVSIGEAQAFAKGDNDGRIAINSGASIESTGNLTVRSTIDSVINSLATTDEEGLGSGADSDSEALLAYQVATTVTGNLTARGALQVESRVKSNVQADSETEAGGLGADGESDSDARIGATTISDNNDDPDDNPGNDNTSEGNAISQTTIGAGAALVGSTVTIAAYVDKMRAHSFAETDVDAVGADADAYADTFASGINEVRLLDGSEITGNERITVDAVTNNVSITARSDSDLDALGGDTDSFSEARLNNRSKVEAFWEALLRTSELVVNAVQNNPVADATERRSGAVFDDGSSSSPETNNARREIFWESHVYLLGEPNPELEIDETGEIVTLTNVEFLGANAGKGAGDSLVGDQVILKDIVYDQAGKVTFFANNLSEAPESVIWGNHGLIESQRTWDYVRLINDSALDLVVNHIDTSDGASVVDIKVDTIPFSGDNDANNNISLNPDVIGNTFEFDLNLFYPQTAVEIRNRIAGSNADSDIILLGGIENTIGFTTIENQRGNIRVDERNLVSDQGALPPAIFDEGLIRTNTLDVDASGDIGNQSAQGGRSALMVELVRITHTVNKDVAPTLKQVHLQADAGGDAVLDISLFDRSQDPALSNLSVTIDRMTAGDDIDVVINDSRAGADKSDIDGITVNTFNPDGTVHNPNYSDEYFDHFHRDVSDASLYDFIRRTYGTGYTEVDSTYTFSEVRAGDDIDIGHVDTTVPFGEPRNYATTSIGGTPYGASVTEDTVSGTTVHFVVNTDVDWTGGTSEDGIELIFLTTNGDIMAAELAGDMLVGHIHSTAGDVTLSSPRRILDADSSSTIDVTADDITMTAGTGGAQGGIGLPTDYLEINVDRNDATGVLRAFDTAAASSNGIYLDELLGDLRVDLVHTTADVSLRTVGGSILEGRPGGVDGDDDFAADVIGVSIDLDANGSGANIGAFANDLEIDSSVGATGDVGLEATDSIFLTEADANLRLLLAHTYTGDIRLTVRESADLDEVLDLLASGSARFAESNTRLPGNDPDASRIVPHGQIFAEQGMVLLRVGDDVTLDDNSEIAAAESIDIYGDFGNADVDVNGGTVGDGHGTTMTLRGRLVAGAVVTPGDPMGTYVPSATAPVYATNVWGHVDTDSFQFGDPSGAAGTTTWGQDGYVFIGSVTRVHGSQDIDSTGDDGEDRFIVYFLQDADVTTGQLMQSAARHTLTLDGQADTDYYEVYTLGSNGADQRNNVINVLDTGAENDGVDELMIFGLDSPDNGLAPGGSKFPADDIFLLRAAAFLPDETADRPGYVALLHGDLESYTDVDETTNSSTEVQRINYDSGLNGRLTVLGQGGNDYFAADDSTVNVTLDGGEGFDTFRVGQIFGLKRTDEILEGGLLPQDVFPQMVATTRGWLSPGLSAPMVVHGGTGNDEFTVYSNQAELRLEGDDDNDLFVIRAFALAAVSTKDWNNDGTIAAADLAAVNVDTNGDGVINAADADETPDDWTDDTIVLDEDGIAVPKIGRDFSTFRPLDIRAGGGEDEVQYNINAPVSVDGGTGFDKLVILGTEFADDFAITEKGIFGAGLNARYANVEIVEIDGLEGDDQFFVQSTAFGVAYRVIGGLGSDAINVTGDVTEDIVTRELEGVSGAVDHLVTSEGDPLYDGLVVDGFDYHVATPEEGIVMIRESAGFTAVREGGGSTALDNYFVRLAVQPTTTVYVTVSAARSPQEESDDTLVNPAGLPNAAGDSIWVGTTPPANPNNPLDGEFQRTVYINGVATQIDNRAVVLTFTPDNYNVEQAVFVYALDDPRAEGDRVVVTSHTVISGDDRYDAADVRNVEVQVRDNDTPGVSVTEVEPGTSIEDGRTLVIEGDNTTELTDEILVQLAKAPEGGDLIVVRLDLDRQPGTDQQIKLIDVLDDARFDPIAGTIVFTAANWDDPVRVGIAARDDGRREDPGTAVIFFERDASTIDINNDYVFPNLRSGIGALDIEVIDDETAGAVVLESGGTLLIEDDPATSAVDPVTDDYRIRLTRQPETGATVEVAVLTDGQADVTSVDGNPITLQEIGGYRPTQLFNGSIVFENVAGKGTLTRGTGADLGDFVDEGFTAGQFIRIGGAGSAYDGEYYIESVTHKTSGAASSIRLTTAFSVGSPMEVPDTVVLSDLTREGLWEGQVALEIDGASRRIVRTDLSGWLADGFLEGQRIRITNLATGETAEFKIALIRGDNDSLDEKIEFTAEGVLPSWLDADGELTNVRVSRIAPVMVFNDSDWYQARTVELVADEHYEVPITREGVKIFPVSTHLLSKLRGPLAVEGGVTSSDRSLQNGLKLPGERDDFLIAIGAQPPESQQIDVLNVFNGSSQQDRDGTMDKTTLRGFGMAEDLDFGALLGLSEEDADTFGESLVFPGGISYGKINFGSGGFETDGGQTTIEVLNVMLGEGNDALAITDTLKPAPQVSASNVFTFTPTADGGTVFRAGFDWKAQGFLIGQTVTIEGLTGVLDGGPRSTTSTPTRTIASAPIPTTTASWCSRARCCRH
jgi:hypothetical protein